MFSCRKEKKVAVACKNAIDKAKAAEVKKRARYWVMAGVVCVDMCNSSKAGVVNRQWEVAEQLEGEPPIYC